MHGLPNQSDKSGDFATVSVMIEPRSPHTDDEILALLQNANLAQVTQLAPGFISAAVPAHLLTTLKDMAMVTVKALKKIH